MNFGDDFELYLLFFIFCTLGWTMLRIVISCNLRKTPRDGYARSRNCTEGKSDLPKGCEKCFSKWQRLMERLIQTTSKEAENKNPVNDWQTTNREVESLKNQLEEMRVMTRQKEDLKSLLEMKVEMNNRQVEDLKRQVEEMKMNNWQLGYLRNQVEELRMRLTKIETEKMLTPVGGFPCMMPMTQYGSPMSTQPAPVQYHPPAVMMPPVQSAAPPTPPPMIPPVQSSTPPTPRPTPSPSDFASPQLPTPSSASALPLPPPAPPSALPPPPPPPVASGSNVDPQLTNDRTTASIQALPRSTGPLRYEISPELLASVKLKPPSSDRPKTVVRKPIEGQRSQAKSWPTVQA